MCLLTLPICVSYLVDPHVPKLPTYPSISHSVSLQEPLHRCQVEGEADGLPLSFKLGAHVSK